MHEKGHAVYAVDLPGFGKSDEPNGANSGRLESETIWGTKEYARFVDDYRKAVGLGDQKINLIGHSFGGQVSIWYAAFYKKHIKNLILIAAAGVRGELSTRQKASQAVAKIIKPFKGALDATGASELAYKVAARLSGNYDYAVATPHMRQVLKKVVNHDLRSICGRIEAPTLLIWGTQDNLTPLSQGEELASCIKDSKMVIIPEAGHSEYKQQPGYFADTIADFIN